MKGRGAIYLLCLLAALLLPLSVGCGDDDADDVDAALDAGIDAAPDSGPEVPITDVTVYVIAIVGDATEAAVGANVRLDLPDGGNVELEADAAGIVVFQDVEWPGGTAAVTAHYQDWMLASWVNLTRSDDRITLWLVEPTPASDTVTITGSASDIMDPSHVLTINSGVDYWQDTIAPYNLQAPRDEPFVLLATEFSGDGAPVGPQGTSQTFHQWYVLNHPGLSASATIDVDFADSATSYSATGVLELPARTDSPLRTGARFYATVSSEESLLNGSYGWPTFGDINAAGDAFDFSMEWVEPSSVLLPRTFYYAYTSDAYSQVLEHGYPEEGAPPVRLLDVPDILSPVPYGPPHPIHAPVEVQFHEPEQSARMILLIDDEIVWWVYTYCDAASITVPLAPSTLDEVQFWGSTAVQTIVQVFDEVAPDEMWLYRAAQSREFTLAP